MSTSTFDITQFVLVFFMPCIALGAILPAGASMICGLYKAVTSALGIRDLDE